jgi:glucose-1-phosphate cytidylyltransferase
MIRSYFNHYYINRLDYRLSLADNRVEYLDEFSRDWTITFVDTGMDTQTGGRVKMVEKYITEDNFFVTYGDGLGDIDIGALLAHHQRMDRLATVTGVDYRSQYGVLSVKDGAATAFKEKPLLSLTINAGFIVFNRAVFQYLTDDKRVSLESTLLKRLAAIDELSVYKHDGFWIGIDTYKDLVTAQQNFQRLAGPAGPDQPGRL